MRIHLYTPTTGASSEYIEISVKPSKPASRAARDSSAIRFPEEQTVVILRQIVAVLTALFIKATGFP